MRSKKQSKEKKKGSKIKRVKAVGKEIGKTMDKVAKSGADILKKIEKADRDMNRKMEKILKSVDKV